MHDARIYRRSKVHKFVNAGKLLRDGHISGDSAYFLEEKI